MPRKIIICLLVLIIVFYAVPRNCSAKESDNKFWQISVNHDYLIGLESASRNFDRVYSDFPSSLPGTEQNSQVSYQNSNLYLGLKGKFLNNGAFRLKYFLPIDNVLQGYALNLAWDF